MTLLMYWKALVSSRRKAKIVYNGSMYILYKMHNYFFKSLKCCAVTLFLEVVCH
jgi:hypothetical protein